MVIGSLFSGIGGLELGFERAGLGHVAWQVERDPFCRRVLETQWRRAERIDGINKFGGLHADLICGGFPCQDLSNTRTNGDPVLLGDVGANGGHARRWRRTPRSCGHPWPSTR